MARSIYVFQGEVESPDYQSPPQPIPRDQLTSLFQNELDGMIRYRVLGKHHFTHNNYGLESNLKYEDMPCIRFDLRKTGVDTLMEYLQILTDELGPLTIFNPEKERFVLSPEEATDRDTLRNFLWPPDFNFSIEEI